MRNLSLALSRFISVELHGVESFIAQKFWHVCKFEMHVYLHFRSFNLKFSVYGLTYVRKQTYTRILQCCHASVGLAQACPNHSNSQTYPLGVNTKVDRVACWGKSEFGGKGEGEVGY